MATNDEIFPGLHRPQPAARHRRPGDRRDLRGGDVEPERIARIRWRRPSILDFYQPLTGARVSEAQLLKLSRWLTAAWGLVLIAIAILARGWGSVFTVGLTIASIVYGPMLGAFLLGVLTTQRERARRDRRHWRVARLDDRRAGVHAARLDLVCARGDGDLHDGRPGGEPCQSMTPARVVERARAAGVFPAAAVEVGSSAGSVWSEAFGTGLDTPFDLASLTKVIATTTVVMELVRTGALQLDEPVSSVFAEWRGARSRSA